MELLTKVPSRQAISRAGQFIARLTTKTNPVPNSTEATLDTMPYSSMDVLKSDMSLDIIRPFSQIPGPRALPFIGTLWDFIKKEGLRFSKMFEIIEKRAKIYGPIYREQFGSMTAIIISDPWEYAKVIRVDGKYPRRLELEPMAHYHRVRGTSLGLVNSQGEEWYRLRAPVSRKIMVPQEVLNHVKSMDEVASDFVEHIRRIQQQSNGVVSNIENEIFKWALESFGTVMFEERLGLLNDPIPKMAQQFFDNLSGFFASMQRLIYVPYYKIIPTKDWKIFETHFDRVIDIGKYFIDKKIDALQKQATDGVNEGDKEQSSEFITYLLSKSNLTIEDVRTISTDLFIGSVETTSSTLLLCLYCLSTSPSTQDTLYQETMKLFPDGGKITSDKIQNLHYVKACVRETLRIYPLAFLTSRIVPKDIEVCGYQISAGTHCMANIYGICRNADFFPDPLRFMPERWLRDNQKSTASSMPYLNFGHGPRMCPGRRLAEQELYILLSKIIRNFKVEFVGKEEIQPISHTALVPDRPVELSFTPRNGI